MEMTEVMEQKDYEVKEETMTVEETGVENIQNQNAEALLEGNEQPLPTGFWQDDRGIGVIEIVLILVILIALVLIFKNEITSIVTNAFARISGDANSIIQ